MGGYEIAGEELSGYLKTTGKMTERTFAAVGTKCREISEMLTGKKSLTELTGDQRRILRSDLYLTSESLGKLMKQHKLEDADEQKTVATLKSHMDKLTKFIPTWVKIAVALALGLGTMIGWKRIVVTVGEKIGKEHLTYAQGAAAELVAAGTDSRGGSSGSAGQHHARAEFRRGGDHGRKPERTADGHAAQPAARLGADASRVRAAGRRYLCVRVERGAADGR